MNYCTGMKKLFLLITILLFVSGCEIDYKIIYNSSNDITEEVTVGVYNSIIYLNSIIHTHNKK